MSDRLLRIPEVAERLGIDRSHTYALIRQGRFPVPIIRDLGDMRVSERALERWMESSGQLPAAPRKESAEPKRRRARVVSSGETVVPFPG